MCVCILLVCASFGHLHPTRVGILLTCASLCRVHLPRVCIPLASAPACFPLSLATSAPPPRVSTPLHVRSPSPERIPLPRSLCPQPPPPVPAARAALGSPPRPPPRVHLPSVPPIPRHVPLPWRGHPRGVAVLPAAPQAAVVGGDPRSGSSRAGGGAREGKGPGSSGAPPARPTPPPAPRGPPLTEAGEGLAAAERRESHFLPTRFSSGDGCRGNKKKDKSLDPRHGQGSSCSGSRAAAARTCGDVLRLGRPIAHGRLLRRSLLGKDRCQQLKNTPGRGESRQE